MVDLRHELELGWFEGIIRGEVYVEEEDAAGVGGVFRAHDCGLPVELVGFVLGAGRAVSRWVFAEIDQFFLDSF